MIALKLIRNRFIFSCDSEINTAWFIYILVIPKIVHSTGWWAIFLHFRIRIIGKPSYLHHIVVYKLRIIIMQKKLIILGRIIQLKRVIILWVFQKPHTMYIYSCILMCQPVVLYVTVDLCFKWILIRWIELDMHLDESLQTVKYFTNSCKFHMKEDHT